MKTSEILGHEVRGSDERVIGTVRDLVIDPLTGRIAFAVVDPDSQRFTDLGCLPIPWPALRVREDGEALRLPIATSKMTAAPEVNRDAIEELRRRDVAIEIFSFYGLQPPWEGTERTTRTTESK